VSSFEDGALVSHNRAPARFDAAKIVRLGRLFEDVRSRLRERSGSEATSIISNDCRGMQACHGENLGVNEIRKQIKSSWRGKNGRSPLLSGLTAAFSIRALPNYN
jgi:hypothetical protein